MSLHLNKLLPREAKKLCFKLFPEILAKQINVCNWKKNNVNKFFVQ